MANGTISVSQVDVLTTSGTGTISIVPPATNTNRTLTLPDSSGTLALAGSSLTGVTDSASPYETSLGTGAGGSNTGVNNTFVGYNAGTASTTGVDNTAVGYAALDANTTGVRNTAIGVEALGANTTGVDNTAVGRTALTTNTVGTNNTAVGVSALDGNSSGSFNTAIGRTALGSNTTGANNTAVGYGALDAATTATQNTAVGMNALGATTTAGDNTSVGYGSLSSNTTGASNTAVGSFALLSNTTGYENTAVGFQAGGGITTGHTNLTIGVNCTTELTTGNDNTCVNALNGGNRLFALTTESNRILIGYNGVTNAYVQVAWTVVSDSRDKTDVVDAPYGLSFVQELRPVQYRWDRRSKYENNQPDGTHKEDKKQLGFLAQDVIALEKKYGGVAKDLLIGDDEHDETLKITETKIIPILVKAIQELSAKVAALEAQLATPPATSPAEPNA